MMLSVACIPTSDLVCLPLHAGNVIDVADVYQGGESERIVGRWLKANAAIRHKVIVATKARGAVDPTTAGPNDVGLSRSHLTQALKDSLERLQTDYIDLYQCHVWDDGTPLEETLRTLNDFVIAGVGDTAGERSRRMQA